MFAAEITASIITDGYSGKKGWKRYKNMLHEFSRTELLIGTDALIRLCKSKVAVFGIGGVGASAAEGLARAGVGKFVLVDGDDVCITNINRQIHATHQTLGRPKVEVMKERILDINPYAEVEIHKCFYVPECSDELIKTDYDYIIDAVDSVGAKVDIIVKAKKAGIPVISSMGAGNKMDPTRFEVSDIYKTSVCPLAKVMRKELKRRGVETLKVVYSKEEPVKIPRNEELCGKNRCIGCDSASNCGIEKKQVPGSISFVPPAAGLIIAGEVVKDIIKGC